MCSRVKAWRRSPVSAVLAAVSRLSDHSPRTAPGVPARLPRLYRSGSGSFEKGQGVRVQERGMRSVIEPRRPSRSHNNPRGVATAQQPDDVSYRRANNPCRSRSPAPGHGGDCRLAWQIRFPGSPRLPGRGPHTCRQLRRSPSKTDRRTRARAHGAGVTTSSRPTRVELRECYGSAAIVRRPRARP